MAFLFFFEIVNAILIFLAVFWFLSPLTHTVKQRLPLHTSENALYLVTTLRFLIPFFFFLALAINPAIYQTLQFYAKLGLIVPSKVFLTLASFLLWEEFCATSALAPDIGIDFLSAMLVLLVVPISSAADAALFLDRKILHFIGLTLFRCLSELTSIKVPFTTRLALALLRFRDPLHPTNHLTLSITKLPLRKASTHYENKF